MIADTIIREGESTPENVILYAPLNWSLAFPPVAQETTVMLWASETQAQAGADETDIVVTRILPGIALPVPGVYPVEGHVRTPDVYGPTGMEFVGREYVPPEDKVENGYGYGEDAAEFIGNLTGGGVNIFVMSD